MKIVFAPSALRDIDEILEFVRSRSPVGARNLSIAIEHAIKMCARHPRAAAKTDEPQVYRRPIARYRYTVFYRVVDGRDGIEVVRAIHAARVASLSNLPRTRS